MVESRKTLAELVNKLFTTVRKSDGTEYNNAEVARWCANYTGETFSRAYMGYLRNGERANPTKRHMQALAAFFEVPEAYFFDTPEGEQTRRDLDLAAAFRDGTVSDDLRAINLPDDTIAAIEQVLRQARPRTR